MLSKTKIFLTVLVIASFVLIAGNVSAADTPKSAIASNAISYPYLAKPVSPNVNIRSGGGTAYYSCGKLKLNENVTVVAQEYGWAKIVPPKGSFSWIAKKYVKTDPSNPNVGIVSANDVRVWVGSPEYDALTSSTTQTKLSKKNLDVVELLGAEDNEYLKIAPPAGAYLYVFASNLNYIGPVGAIPAAARKTPKVKPADAAESKTAKSDVAKPAKPLARKPAPKSVDTKKFITTCRQIAEKAEAEKEKPYAKQDYKELKKAVDKIANDPKAGKAKIYAQYVQNLISRFELVADVEAEIQASAKAHDDAQKKIEDDRDKKIAKVVDPGKYVVEGIIKPSSIFNAGQKRYIILDDNGRIICYAVPGSYISKNLLKNFYNKKVALEGTIEKRSYGTVSLVKFSAIVDADSIKK